MKIFRFHSMFVCLFGFFASNATSIIPFQLVNGLIVVNAQINQNRGFFILDTGADEVLIDEGIVSTGDEKFKTLNGEIVAKIQKIDRLELGSLVFRNLNAFAVDLSSMDEYTQIDIKGIVGVKLFKEKVVVIDFERKLVTFEDVEKGSRTNELISYHFDVLDDLPMIKIDLGGSQYHFLLDSGATRHMIDKTVIASHPENFIYLNADVSVATASNQQQKARKFIAEKFDLKGKGFFDQVFLEMDLLPLNEGRKMKIDGIFSLSSLTTGKVVIDLKKSLISF